MTVSHHPEKNRFETDHAEPAYIEYERRDGDVLDLRHTIVPEHLEGQGVGSALVRGALDYARTNGQRVVPTCSFVRSWLDRHEGYEDLVA